MVIKNRARWNSYAAAKSIRTVLSWAAAGSKAKKNWFELELSKNTTARSGANA